MLGWHHRFSGHELEQTPGDGEVQVQLQVSVSSVQFSLSVVSDSATPWTAAHQASLSLTISQSLLKLLSIESVILSHHSIL